MAIRRVPKSFDTISTIYEERVSRAVRQRQITKINRESLRLVTNISEDMRDRIGEVLREGVEEGRSVAATASKLLTTGLDKGVFRSARKRAYLIARTELHRARQQAAIDLYEANKISIVKWVAIADGRICNACLKMEGRIYKLSDIKKKGLYPPVHPRCRCRILPSEFQLTIKVKHDKEGKVLETRIAPNPKDYSYIIKLEKSQIPVKTFIRMRRGKYETVKPYLRTKEDIRKELTADIVEVAKKYGVSVKDLEYSGLRSFKPLSDHYVHLWTIIGPKEHELYESTVTSGKKYDIKKNKPIDLRQWDFEQQLQKPLPKSSIITQCPNCGLKSKSEKCPNCGTGLVKSDLASTQVELPEDLASTILDLVDQIDPDDLHPTEKQDDNVHVTVLYGLTSDVPGEVKKILSKEGSIKASIEAIDVFQPKDRDYDVLILRVDSPDLHNLSQKLRKLPNENSFPFYEPHITIAYLKRGKGDKYRNLVTGVEGAEIEFNTVVFSSKDNKRTIIQLSGDLEKARPYIRTRRGRLEHVKGYPHKPRLFDVPFEKRISQAWDSSREDVRVANRVAHEIQAIGGKALIVGGFVRDSLMGRKSKDIDIEVYGVRPDELRNTLERIGKVDAVGVSFGVLKLKTPELDEPLDISIPRRDNKVGPGHKGFNVEADSMMTTKEAARRRDLTINALSYDPITKEIIDDFGGIQDIKDRVLRMVDPGTFVEDPLRVLRVMQFAGRFEFSPDVKTALVCGQVNLEELPKERIYGELEKLLLKSRMPSIGLRLIPILRINKIMPELDALRKTIQDPKFHPEGACARRILDD